MIEHLYLKFFKCSVSKCKEVKSKNNFSGHWWRTR